MRTRIPGYKDKVNEESVSEKFSQPSINLSDKKIA